MMMMLMLRRAENGSTHKKTSVRLLIFYGGEGGGWKIDLVLGSSRSRCVVVQSREAQNGENKVVEQVTCYWEEVKKKCSSAIADQILNEMHSLEQEQTISRTLKVQER